jgi:hypothetical protein
MITIKCQIIEVGALRDGNNGCVFESNGKKITISGLDISQCKILASNMFDVAEFELTIAPADAGNEFDTGLS